MINKSLFDIEAEYINTINELEEYFAENPEADGEIPEEFLERLEINKDEMGEKLGNYRKAIDIYKYEIEFLDNEIERKQRVKSRKQAQIERLSLLMKQATLRYGNVTGKDGTSRNFKTDDVSVSVRYTRPVEIDDLDAIPNELCNGELKIKSSYYTVNELNYVLDELKLKHAFTVDISKNPVKASIKEAIEAGNEVPGAYIDTERTMITIR